MSREGAKGRVRLSTINLAIRNLQRSDVTGNASGRQLKRYVTKEVNQVMILKRVEWVEKGTSKYPYVHRGKKILRTHDGVDIRVSLSFSGRRIDVFDMRLL